MSTKAKSIAVGKAVIDALQLGSQVAEERARQVEKWGTQRHPWVSRLFSNVSPGHYARAAELAKRRCQGAAERHGDSWDLIFLEEVYEALEELEKGDLSAARTELVQVMAVAAAIVQHIDEETGR